MKKFHLIALLLITVLFLQACETRIENIDLSDPSVYLSLESSQSDKIVEVDNTTYYFDLNLNIGIDGSILDMHSIPLRLVLDVTASETVNLKICKNIVCEMKTLTLYYLSDDYQIKNIPYEKILTAPEEVGLYPVIIEGTIYNSYIKNDEKIKLILFLKVSNAN